MTGHAEIINLNKHMDFPESGDNDISVSGR